MKNKLLIIGASGHGKVVADIAMKMKRWESISYLDDNQDIKTSLGLNVIGTTENLSQYVDEYDMFVGVGNNGIREKVYKELFLIGASIPTLIHPSAIVSEHVDIDIGTTVMAGAIINCCTKIGKGCIVNTGSSIDHDNIIDDFVHISPGVHLAGTVEVGKCTWLGIGSIVSNNITITNQCNIGAGAVVNKDINDSGTYIGVPIRRVNK